MTTRLLEIAEELKKNYLNKADAEAEIYSASKNLEDLLVQIIPEGGWPGKNDTERKAARDKAELENVGCQKANEKLKNKRIVMIAIDGINTGLEAERRALEWQIRADLVARMPVTAEKSTQPETAAFDAVQDEMPF